jgi:periplasmic protein TonB
VDGIVNGGGGGSPQVMRTPTPNPSAPNPPAPNPPRPAPVAPPVTPPPTPRNNNNTAVVPELNRQKTSKAKAPTDTSTSKSTNPSFTLKDKTAKADKTAKTSNPSQNPGKASKERQEAFNRTFKELGQGLSTGGLTMSDTPGNGAGGGPGAVNYSQAVLGAYDDAWNPPAELTEDVAVAVIKIVVNRTGRIDDARIIKRSGNALMDRSVQNALEAVKSLPPFPEGAKDIERTFRIEFNLKVKRGVG